MPGPLSDESLRALRRVTRKMGYVPNHDTVDNLLATIDERDRQLRELYRMAYTGGVLILELLQMLDKLGAVTPEQASDIEELVEVFNAYGKEFK